MSNIQYDLFSSDVLSDKVQLLYVASAQFGPDWHSKVHTHNCTELIFCQHGIGTFHAGEKTQALGSDDLVIINAYVEHTESSFETNPLEYIVLGISGIDFLFEDINKGYTVFNYRSTREEINFYLREFIFEIQHKSEQWATVCQNLLNALLIKLTRYTNISLRSAPFMRNNKECFIVHQYIDNHYAENITLDYLAEYAHLNKYYLVHAFTKEYGISPINYLISRRIFESKYLLGHTNHSLSHIAHILGFSSPSYFSQSFRRIEQQSPMDYRKAQRNIINKD